MTYQSLYLNEWSGRSSDLPLSKNRTNAGRFLLAGMILERYGKTDYSITYNENGKPLLDFCFFSISHSSDLVVCTVSDKPVGIDTEKKKPIKKRKTYLLFSNEESRYVNQAKDPSLAFLTIWTRKEAYVKAIGGTLANMADIQLVTGDLQLKSDVKAFSFQTEYKDGYLISIATA